MKAERSNFAGVPGLIFLALLFAAAAWFQLKTAQGVLLALFFVFLTAFLWSKHALDKIDVTLPGSEMSAFPGESFRAEVSLANRKLLPLLWLTAELPLPEDPCVSAEDGGESLEASFRWVMPQQKITYTQTAAALHRGVCSFERLTLRSGDGFGLSVSEKQEQLRSPVRFVVYPQVFPVDTVPVTRRMSELESDRRGLYTDPTLIYSIRDYQDGDSFRNINWRMLAREDRLMTNVRERLSMRRICLIPDLESYSLRIEEKEGSEIKEAYSVEREGFEKMLSLAASLAVALSEKGVLCTLLIPAYGEVPESIAAPETAEGAVPELLTALAEISYCGGSTSLGFAVLNGREHLIGQPFVLHSGRQCPALRRFSAGLDRRVIGIDMRAQDGGEAAIPDDPFGINAKELMS